MRIAFSDLDGTLLASDKTVPERTWRALDELARRGIEFVPCSGRPVVGIPHELLAHPAVHYAVCGNGTLVCRVGEGGEPGEVLHRELMGAATAERLYEPFRDRDVLFDVFGDGRVYSERHRYERMATFDLDPHFLPQLRRMRTPIDVSVPEMLPKLEHVERVTVYWKHPEDRDLAVSLVEADPRLTWVSSIPINVEISTREASKGAALSWLCGFLGIPTSEAVAFGDSSNDASMLEAAGDGVAMANATPEAVRVADHRCEDNDAPGVALYLERLLAR